MSLRSKDLRYRGDKLCQPQSIAEDEIRTVAIFGNAGAASLYERIAAQWKNADAGFPDLEEVRAGAGKKDAAALR